MMAVSLCCWKIWLVLITLTILDTLITRVSMTYSSPSGTGSRFIRRQSLDGFVAPGPSVAVYPRVASVVYCAAMCSADTECMSFFYKPLTATCDLRNDIISVGVTGNADPGSIYFHLDTSACWDISFPFWSVRECQRLTVKLTGREKETQVQISCNVSALNL